MGYVNPYQGLSGGRWCKANFHAHAGTGAGTCGFNPVQDVIELYRSNNFDILCISNHDQFTDTSALSGAKPLMVPGVEYSQKEHMLTIGVRESLHELDHQSAIDKVNASGGFVILCHPNWRYKEYWSHERVMALDGYLGIEVINFLIYRLSGSGRATDTWDRILTEGRMTYGFGNDDFHSMSDASRSFNFIYCREESFSGVREAVTRGALVASSGLAPEFLELDGRSIRAKVRHERSTFVDTYTYRFITEGGKVLSTVEGSEASYTLNGEKYVRVEAAGENGALLFFQPIYLREAFKQA